MVTTILSVKAVGLCSKHRDNTKKDSLDILTYKDGRIIPDKEIECISCELKGVNK